MIHKYIIICRQANIHIAYQQVQHNRKKKNNQMTQCWAARKGLGIVYACVTVCICVYVWRMLVWLCVFVFMYMILCVCECLRACTHVCVCVVFVWAYTYTFIIIHNYIYRLYIHMHWGYKHNRLYIHTMYCGHTVIPRVHWEVWVRIVRSDYVFFHLHTYYSLIKMS